MGFRAHCRNTQRRTSPDRPGSWRGSLFDPRAGRAVVVRELHAGGTHLTSLMMWSEVFARCDDPPAAVRWSDPVAFDVGRDDPVLAQERQAAGRDVDPRLVAYGDYTHASGIVAMQRLLHQSPDLDAVFVNSDLMAIGAISTIQDSGQSVPEDIAVVGYDDLSIATYNNLPLTTIRQNFPLVGKLMAQNLIQYIQSGVVTNVTTPVELVIRQSA